jgi:hypothetical protein
MDQTRLFGGDEQGYSDYPQFTAWT